MPALLTSTSIDRKRASAVSTTLAAVAGSPTWPSTRATWSEAVTSVDWVTFRELARTLKPRSTNALTIPAPMPCEAPVTMAVFCWPLMVVYLEPGSGRRSGGSEVRVQHDAVTGLAGLQAGESFVDLTHREGLGLRRHVVPRREVEHRLDRHRRARRRTRDATLLEDERECRDRDGLQHGTDDMQPAVRRERADQRVPIELHVDGADQEVEAAAEPPDRRGVLARDDVVGPEGPRLVELAFARRERGHVAAVGGGELHGHVPQPADADDADPIGRFGMPGQRCEDGDAPAKQRPRVTGVQPLRQRDGPGPVSADVACEPASVTDDSRLHLRAEVVAARHALTAVHATGR